jgi:hypothetical protein
LSGFPSEFGQMPHGLVADLPRPGNFPSQAQHARGKTGDGAHALRRRRQGWRSQPQAPPQDFIAQGGSSDPESRALVSYKLSPAAGTLSLVFAVACYGDGPRAGDEQYPRASPERGRVRQFHIRDRGDSVGPRPQHASDGGEAFRPPEPGRTDGQPSEV